MRTLVITAQADFELPVAEATRKQSILLTQSYISKNIKAELLVISSGKMRKIKYKNICLHIGSINNIWYLIKLIRNFHKVHFIGALGYKAVIIAIFSLFKKKYVTLTDGAIFSIQDRWFFKKIVSKFTPFLYQRIYIYTQYQEKILDNNFKFIKNKLFYTYPFLNFDRIIEKNETSQNVKTILYMGHLSTFKGVDIVFSIFESLIHEIEDIKLIIALNGLNEDLILRKKLNRLKECYPNQIEEKGKIVPKDELEKTSLYIYPVGQHAGTHAFPFSLYESIQCMTPFISTNLDGFSEYFNDFFLVDKNDKNKYLLKAKEILLESENIHIQQKLIKNHKMIKHKIENIMEQS